jgi:hypothetical protein
VANLNFSHHPELWLVRGKLVATTASYNMPYCKPNVHEVRHYYCGICGDEWGMRVSPDFPNATHYFYRSRCFKHGGTEDMLNPYERHFMLDIFSTEVLAYLFLVYSQTLEVYHEDESSCKA